MSVPKFTLEVVTPDGVVFNEEVQYLRASGENGQFGVLAGHAPLLTGLNIGTLEVKDGNSTYYLAVSGGFCEVLSNKTVILAETAEVSKNIDVERAKSSLERARDRLKDTKTETNVERARLAIARALNRIRVAEFN